ncbi:MAG: acylneuraminate cytidylyltransferase family protein [Syntrophorhabdaceae bacterium]
MYKDKSILATVCARGGSKGVKGKNIRILCRQPVIKYTLDLLKDSSIIDDYIISTESDLIIDVVKNAGFAVRFKRPAELAGDKVSRIEPIQHAVTWIEKEDKKHFDIIVDLGVATPLKSVEDMENCIKLAIDSDADNVLSACPSSRNPYYNMVEIIDSRVKIVKEIRTISDRRDAPIVFDLNDAFNVWKHDVLFRENCQFNDTTKLFIMPRERSIDIDEEIDFILAEFFMMKKEKDSENVA